MSPVNTLEENALPLVLIVDDDPDNIKVLAKILELECDVRFTTRGDKVIGLAESQKPDLILLDVVMPGLDGYEVCKLLKQNDATNSIPVIFVTAMGEEQYEATGFEVGGVDYVTKPVKPFLLLARVKTHIELKRKNDLLKTLSMIDGLTGIANRRRMDDFLNYEWRRAVRQGDSKLSCILIDVDHFKNFNDGYGHQAGDNSLKSIATTIWKTMARSTDLVARYGGEEFICILPETSLEGAAKLATKIRENIAAQAIPHAYSDAADHVTVSAGVATMIPEANSQPSALIEAADRQLYEAKRSGRNNVSCEG